MILNPWLDQIVRKVIYTRPDSWRPRFHTKIPSETFQVAYRQDEPPFSHTGKVDLIPRVSFASTICYPWCIPCAR